ncbi:MAG: DmsC/YnfH family molybdoenzyme membrane anchor subunit [Pseudomonadota bacterium]
MHPATSIIVFTVCSGAGFGLLFALGLPALWGDAPSGALAWAGFILAFALSVGGLMSSTFHLGHPERAWRAFSQWRSSWLSREGVLAVVTLGLAGFYALACIIGLPGAAILGPLTAVMSLLTVYATSMIYAQLKTVDRWHTLLTPLCFLAFATASGEIIVGALRAAFADGPGIWPLTAALSIFIAWTLKQRAWRQGDARAVAPVSTTESATGLGFLGSVRLFEAPHTGPNYLLNEMGFTVARRHAEKLRFFAVLVGGFLPMILTLMASSGLAPTVTLVLGSVALLAGLFIERWLFFAEARHSVMAYYDRRTA